MFVSLYGFSAIFQLKQGIRVLFGDEARVPIENPYLPIAEENTGNMKLLCSIHVYLMWKQ